MYAPCAAATGNFRESRLLELRERLRSASMEMGFDASVSVPPFLSCSCLLRSRAGSSEIKRGAHERKNVALGERRTERTTLVSSSPGKLRERESQKLKSDEGGGGRARANFSFLPPSPIFHYSSPLQQKKNVVRAPSRPPRRPRPRRRRRWWPEVAP